MTSFILHFSLFGTFAHPFFDAPSLSPSLSSSLLPSLACLLSNCLTAHRLPSAYPSLFYRLSHHLLFSEHMWWVVRKRCNREVYFHHQFNINAPENRLSVHCSLCFLLALHCPSPCVSSSSGSHILCLSFPSTLSFRLTNPHSSPLLLSLNTKAQTWHLRSKLSC